MIHEMQLQDRYFDYIKYGTKEYEIRLNDEKRSSIKKGDFIEFQKASTSDEKILVMVDDLYYYKNFSELFNDIDISLLADFSVDKEKLENDLSFFYSEDKQNKYGVVAIKLDKTNIISCKNLKSFSYDDSIFYQLKESYNNFKDWFVRMQLEGACAFYTKKNGEVTSIMILKFNEVDSQQFLKKGNVMKIRTLIVNDKNRGIGTMYLKIVSSLAKVNNIDFVYLTVKMDNKELIEFIEKKGYKKYNKFNDECVYYKELI